MPFPTLSAQREMQTASSKIWTVVVDSIFNDETQINYD